MTEMVNGMNQGSDASSSQPVVTQSQTVSQSSTNEAREKLFKQSEVNDIVSKAKHDAVETFRRLNTEQPQYAAQKYGMNETSFPQQQPSNAQMPSFNENDIKRMAAEETQRLRNEWIQDAHKSAQEQEAQRIAQSFFGKLSTGKEKYQDFDSLMDTIHLPSYSNTVQMVNDLDNTSDVWHHLMNDPFKLQAIESMASNSPKAAHRLLKQLSDSMKTNEDASKIKLPREPLSQMRPSNTGTDNGALSVSDYRKRYKV